jgi:hypothetical protein
VIDYWVFRENEALSYRAAPEMASGKMKFKSTAGFADGFFAKALG